MQRDWVDYASAIGSLATLGTLIYVLVKEWRTRKYITDLAVLAKEMQEQNQLQRLGMKIELRPEFGHPNTNWFEEGKNLTISLVNKGETARIYDIDYDEKYFEFEKHIIPCRIPPNGLLIFRGVQKDHNPRERELYTILLHMTDALGNKYECKIAGDHYNVRISSGEE